MYAGSGSEPMPSDGIRRPPRLPYSQDSKSHTSNRSVSQVDSISGQELITYIFPDFKAVSYFKKEFELLNEFHVAEETVSSGFEIYLVDQWIRGRKIGTVMSVYTGNPESKVKVTKFMIVKKPSKQYPARFQEYLNEVMLNHATFKKMEMLSKASKQDSSITEFLFVTDMSAVPHNLNIIALPGGDTRQVESTYIVNSNLKKLNCGGRSLSLLAEKVSDASEDKFRQMYRIHNEAVPMKFAVLQLVNLIQTCLFYFDLLDARYCDGLLCQKTEDAITNWWNLIGLPHFNVKPSPRTGVLPSKTVAAIISLTISVRMRLHMFGGCDVPKDPFDLENFMISVGQFQKQVKIEKKRKLDLLTLLRLFYYTNQKISADSTKQKFTTFGNESVFDDDELGSFYDSQLSLPTSMRHTAANQSGLNLTASAYRRNKLYYSKEFKKLTNVVKNTVQDHIIVREDNDDIYADPVEDRSRTKLRSKIASKLTDNVTPADIETIDIEILVRRCLIGPTLFKLWLYGANSQMKAGDRSFMASTYNTRRRSLAVSDHNSHHHHHHHHHLLHPGKNEPESDQYKFVSLRQAISSTQEMSQGSDKSGRLSRMRFPFQTRRNPSKSDIWSMGAQSSSGMEPANSSLHDSELQRITDRSPSPSVGCDNASSHVSEVTHKKKLLQLLNRRHSYPFVYSGAETSLNTVELLKNEVNERKGYEPPDQLKKCASFSSLESYFFGNKQLYCLEKAKSDYLNQVSRLLNLERAKKEAQARSGGEIQKDYKQINFELVKLNNIYLHMENKRKVTEMEHLSMLSSKMNDLADNIDRMAFRSRDLLKKINELDENSKMFEFKMQLECVAKLDRTINALTHSTKFQYVFRDETERRRLLFELSGEEAILEEDESANKTYYGIRGFIVFLYEMMLVVLQVFNFDRSKMNLERIRAQYRKLDPNRQYINRAYKFVGRDLVTSIPEGRWSKPDN